MADAAPIPFAVAVVQAGSCGSGSTPSLGTFKCHTCGPKEEKEKKIGKRDYVKVKTCEAKETTNIVEDATNKMRECICKSYTW